MLQEFSAVTDVTVLAKGLEMIPALEAQIKAIRELAYNLAVQGTPIPGHKLVEKRATRKWKDAVSVMAVAPDSWYDGRTLKSPAQVEIILGKAKFAAGMAPMVEKKSGGYTLVPLGDARPPAARLSVDEFSVIDGTEEGSTSPSFTI